MLLEVIPVGSFECNCCIYACEATKEAVVIDPGDEPTRILEVVKHFGVTVTALLHTHAHIDHVAATRAVKEATGAAIYLHKGDEWLYNNMAMQGLMFGQRVGAPLPVDHFAEHGDRIAFGAGHAFNVIHTPGHTPGSICFRPTTETAPVFSGDTLFRRGIGRTDLWGGSYDAIIRSIREKLLALDDDTLVVPGHGPTTRIGEERKRNPFLTD